MVTVAIDVGPLHGPRTGIGNAVAWTIDALDGSDPHRPEQHGDEPVAPIHLMRYLVSTRATVGPSERRLPIPAAAAVRWWSRSSRPRMDRWLGHPDVVHGTNYVVPPTRAPRLVSVYDCWFLDHPESAHPDVRRAGAVLARAVADGAHVVASSAATARRCSEHFARDLDADRLHVVHLGPPTTAMSRPGGIDPVESMVGSEPFIVAIGTVERRKNLPALVDAFAIVAASDPRVRLVIAGRDGDDAAGVDAAVQRCPGDIRDRIIRLDRVDDDTKDWLLHHAAALAYPSLDEGFGFPILEAQLTGTAVVASTAGSIPEVAGDAAVLVDADDTDGLADALLRVLHEPELVADLIAAGHRNVERFSWTTTARQLCDLYVHLAQGAP